MSTHQELHEDVMLYALGHGEMEAVQKHLAECAACRRELQAVREDLGLLALSASGPQPPRRSRERLLAAIAEEPRSSERTSPARNWTWLPWFAALACALFAVLGYFVNLKQRSDLQALRALQESQYSELTQARETLDLLQSQDAMHVNLTSTPTQAKPQGKAIYSPHQARLVFMASNLPPLPPNKAYELWLVPMEGAPIPAGMFKPDSHGNLGMMEHAFSIADLKAKAFAVTMEDEQGSATPTMPMVIAGSAGI